MQHHNTLYAQCVQTRLFFTKPCTWLGVLEVGVNKGIIVILGCHRWPRCRVSICGGLAPQLGGDAGAVALPAAGRRGGGDAGAVVQRGGAGAATLARDAADGRRGGCVRSEQWSVGPRDRARVEGAGKARVILVRRSGPDSGRVESRSGPGRGGGGMGAAWFSGPPDGMVRVERAGLRTATRRAGWRPSIARQRQQGQHSTDEPRPLCCRAAGEGRGRCAGSAGQTRVRHDGSEGCKVL